jgi:hypothetical protein
MIVCGDPSRFAVKWEVVYPSDTPIGRFALSIDGHEIGDFSDDGTDLNGCFCHGLELGDRWGDKFEPGLFDMDKSQAFETLVYPIYGSDYGAPDREEVYADIYGRFHIHHIGMSSMGDFLLLVMKSDQGETRFIWRKGRGDIREAHLPAAEVEAVFAEFLERAEAEVAPGTRAAHYAWEAKSAEIMARAKARRKKKPNP